MREKHAEFMFNTAHCVSILPQAEWAPVSKVKTATQVQTWAVNQLFSLAKLRSVHVGEEGEARQLSTLNFLMTYVLRVFPLCALVPRVQGSSGAVCLARPR